MIDENERLSFFMKNRIDTILKTKGEKIDSYESSNISLVEMKRYLETLGYAPISYAKIPIGFADKQYYVYEIEGIKYVLKRDGEVVKFYRRGY